MNYNKERGIYSIKKGEVELKVTSEKSKIKPRMQQEKPYELEPNIEATLAYLPFVGIAVIHMEKTNKFVRFHALQSIFFWISAFALHSMALSLRVLLIGFFLAPIVKVGTTLLWLYLMWKAYNKIEFELPLIGSLAKEQAEK